MKLILNTDLPTALAKVIHMYDYARPVDGFSNVVEAEVNEHALIRNLSEVITQSARVIELTVKQTTQRA